LVHEAERQGALPPVIEAKLLGGELRKPTLPELRDAFALHHLARCLEAKYQSLRHHELPRHSYYVAWNHPSGTQPPKPVDISAVNKAEDPTVWRERFDTAVYTSLLLGAVLSRAYSLPFLDETDSESPSRLSLLDRFTDDPLVGFDGDDLLPHEVNHLIHNFPVYDFLGTLTPQDLAFDSLAEWFVHVSLKELEDSSPEPRPDVMTYMAFFNRERKLFNISPRSSIWPWDKALSSRYTRGGPASEGDALFAAIMRANEMVTFLLRRAVAALDVPSWPRPSIRSEDYTPPSKTRTAKVVLFGIFQAETIQMPAAISESLDCPLVAFKLAPSNQVSDIPGVLRCLYNAVTDDASNVYYPLDQYDPDNIHTGPAMPVPPIQFFAFMLRKYFKVHLEWLGNGTGEKGWRHF
jgi:hypothetical protein